jgi:hypothetical protein
MTEHPATPARDVTLSTGPPETALAAPPEDVTAELDAARQAPLPERKARAAAVAAAHPELLDAWALLAEVSSDPVESYAYARVGYHRGLDALRASGWRGSGYVRAAHPGNLGFLRSLQALADAAARIGEETEATRCAQFLRQLDPDWGRS